MPTIVNNPSQPNNSGAFGFLLGLITLITFVALFIFYGVPAIRRLGTPQITIPTQVVIPENLDVKITN